jgi:thiamine-phosphate pyrophosphorylase
LLLYYITDRLAFPGDELGRRLHLLEKIAEAAGAGVDYIQLREKDLSAHELESLAREAMEIIGKQQLETGNQKPRTSLLINSRTDVALAARTAGVHLRSDDISPEQVRKVWKERGAGNHARGFSPQNPLIAVSCHSIEEVMQAAANQASLAVFAPVFEKKDVPGTAPTGLEKLREACRASIPVLALGGVTVQNAESCLQAGAAGIAAIRLFQENDVASILSQLRY